jgi:tetratricopeptide (TPR) repeat protein
VRAVNCPACEAPNRGGSAQCKRCGGVLPRTCAGCGDPIPDGVTLCVNCRTERVPAALGAHDVEELDPAELTELDDRSYPIAPKFVGRKALVDRLTHMLENVVMRSELAFVALTGPPGIGKSRLADDIGRLMRESIPRDKPPRLLEAVCGGPGAPPYAAFLRILRERFGIADHERDASARERISRVVGELLPSSRATEVAHLIAQLLDCPFPESPVIEPLADTPTQLESRTFIAVRRFLAADAARQPMVLIFDGIERASPETVNLIHYLAAGLASQPVALLCVGRPSLFEAHPTFGEGDVTLERIELGPLSDDETEALVRELTRPAGEAPPELLRHAREKLGGVPRALVELTRYLLETQVIVPADDRKWKFDRERLRATQLPDSLEGILTARLRAMDAAERDLLEKAAACGEAFWLDAVVMLVRAAAIDPVAGRGDPDGPTLGEIAAAGDRTRAEVEAALAVMEKRGLLGEQPHSSIPGEREYRFAYPPWWDVVYEGIGTDVCRRYHRLIAQWLELRPEGRGDEAQEEIGEHLERAGEGDGAALRYRRAADAARAKYFNDRAVRLYSAALECLGQGDLASRIHLWHDLGSVFQLKGELDSALGAFERMLRLAWVVASRTKAAVAFNKMGRVYRQKGELPLALEYLERGLELFKQARDERGIGGSLDDIGQVLWLMSRYDEALDRSAAALEIRRRLGDKRSIASSLVNIGHIERHTGLFDAAEACYREALEIRAALEDKNGIAHCRGGLGMIRFQRSDVDGARRDWEQALELAESIGALPLQARLMNHLGEAARVLGHRGEARTRFEAAEALARDVDDRRVRSEALRNLGLLDLAAGDAASSHARCQQALDIAQAAGIRVDVGRALLALGEVHAATLFDDGVASAKQAEDYFRRGVELFREIGNDAELALGLERFGKYRVERGETDSGRKLLTEAQAIFNRLGMRSETLHRVIGEL